jgi:hypothetical protein
VGWFCGPVLARNVARVSRRARRRSLGGRAVPRLVSGSLPPKSRGLAVVAVVDPPL